MSADVFHAVSPGRVAHYDEDGFKTLDSTQISLWLNSLQLSDFVHPFVEAGLDGTDLLGGLTHDDLDRCGCPKELKPRLKLWRALSSIRGFESSTALHVQTHSHLKHPLANSNELKRLRRQSNDVRASNRSVQIGVIRDMRRLTEDSPSAERVSPKEVANSESEGAVKKSITDTPSHKPSKNSSSHARSTETGTGNIKRATSLHRKRAGWRRGNGGNTDDALEKFIREVNMTNGTREAWPLLWLQHGGGLDASDRPQERIIDPTSWFHVTWQFLVSVLVVWYTIVIPIRLGFAPSKVYGSTDFTDPQQSGFFIWLDLVFDMIFILDVILTLNTAIRPHDRAARGTNRMIADRAGIRRLHMDLSTWEGYFFAVDIIASFPVSLVVLAVPEGTGLTIVKLLRGLKAFRLIRLVRLRNLVSRFTLIDSSSVFRLFKWLTFLVLIWHMVACLFFGLISPDLAGDTDLCAYCEAYAEYVGGTLGEISDTECTFVHDGLLNVSMTEMPTNAWLSQNEDVFRCGLFLDDALYTRYTQSFFWAVMVTFGVGRDIVPQTNHEVWLVITLVILGTVLEAVIIGEISSFIMNLDANETERRRKMESLTSWMDYRGVPSHLQHSIRNYYDFLWSSSQTTNQSEMVSDLPPSLNVRLQLALYLHLIKKVPIFSQCKPDCVAFVITLLKPRICIPGEFIINEGERGTEPVSSNFTLTAAFGNDIIAKMYFVHRGRVQVLWERGVAPRSSSGHGEGMSVRAKDVVLGEIAEGEFFGEGAVTSQNELRSASVKALTYCDLLILSKDDLEVVSSEFPDFRDMVERHNRKRMQSKKRERIIEAAKALRIIRRRRSLTKDPMQVGEAKGPEDGLDENETKKTGLKGSAARWSRLRAVTKLTGGATTNASTATVVPDSGEGHANEEGDEESDDNEPDQGATGGAALRLLEIMGGNDPWLNGGGSRAVDSHWDRLRNRRRSGILQQPHTDDVGS